MKIEKPGKYLLVLGLLFLMLDCSQSKTETTDNTEKDSSPSFEEFVDSVRMQSLPLQIKCGLTDNLASIDEFVPFAKYIPKSVDRVFGRIDSKNKKYKLVIFGKTGDDIYPYLYSYNNEGKILDSLLLLKSYCGGADEKEIPHAVSYISDDMVIDLVDTTRFIHYPKGELSVDVYVVDSTAVSKVIMKLDDEGHFVESK